jgi:Dolichyl-phosphate-mannose-protein mannosyltransferase
VRQRLAMWAPDVAVGAALIALVAWSFWQRWQLLSASPFPLGVDGYFYAVELRSLLDHGTLRYPAAPLAFYLLAPFAAVTDPITGAKLGAALFCAAIALPAYGVGGRLGGGRGAGLVAAVIATTSVGSAYLTVEFVKNGIGLTLALTALWLALRAAEQHTRGRIGAAIAGLVAAYATHKMAAALVLVVAVPAAVAVAASRGALRGRRLLYTIGGLMLLAGIALAIGAVFPGRFLSARDASLIDGLVSTTPRWSAPAMTFPTGELTVGRDALLGLLVAIGAIVARKVRRRRARPDPARSDPARPDPARPEAPWPAAAVAAAAWPILVLAIAIGLPFLGVTDPQGLGFRLRLAAFVPAALASAIAARAVLGRFVHRDYVLVALAVVLAIVRQPGTRLDGMTITHPALVAATQALNGHVPPDATLVVPERHIAFMVAWYTGAPIAIRPDDVPPARRFRLLPLHFIGADSPLDRQLLAARAESSLAPPLGLHPRYPNGLVLVAEPTWRWILERSPPADRARLEAWPTI